MKRRQRTAKTLAQRHDRTYFSRLNRLGRWRLALSILLPAVAVLWLAWHAFAGQQAVYSSGPLSKSHAVFSNQCGVCHTTTLGVFREHVKDETCANCHDGPIHHANQATTPGCAECHMEHTGAATLAAVSDSGCSRCHADLKTKSGNTQFAKKITGFVSDHPEFAILKTASVDQGTIRFNHAVHLKEKLTGPKGIVKLQCSDCHRPASDVEQPWPYGKQIATASVLPAKSVLAPGRSNHADPGMAPVAYQKHCAQCHGLQFDRQISGEVPHGKPEEVRAFLSKTIEDYSRKNPAVLREPVSVRAFLPGKPDETTAGDARSVKGRVAVAEELLWKKTCKQCHQVTGTMDSPILAEAKIADRWFKHAVFDHQPHSILECASCHSKTATSQETSDVLIPGIESCRKCHTSGSKQTQAAEARCFECHQYHDWSKAKPTKGKFKIPDLISRNLTPASF